MPNSGEYYDHSTYPQTGAPGSSAAMRAELDTIEAAFNKLASFTGGANKLIKINAAATGQEASSVFSDDGTDATIAGDLYVTGGQIGQNSGQKHTIPVIASDTFALLAAAQTLTNKTIVAANNTITTAVSGNLTSTNLNAALAELQSDIDARALATSVTSALNSKQDLDATLTALAGLNADLGVIEQTGVDTFTKRAIGTGPNNLVALNGSSQLPAVDGSLLTGVTATPGDETVTPAKLSDDAFISIIGDSKNLIITNNSGTPNSQVDIDADEIILKDTDGRAYLAEAVNLTANIATSGVNGLDTGVEVGGIWYYLWVIYNGTTVASLISASSTAPTMPSGYTYKALVGAIYNDVSGNFIKMRQIDRLAFIARTTITTSIPGTTYSSLSLSAIVPPNAKSVFLQRSDQFGASSSASLSTSPTNSDDLHAVTTSETGGGTSYRNNFTFELPIIESQTIYQKRSGTAPSSTAVYASGWRI
jgi:sulfur transfer complex TusBCD TusB component (DsrH family)